MTLLRKMVLMGALRGVSPRQKGAQRPPINVYNLMVTAAADLDLVIHCLAIHQLVGIRRWYVA